MKVELLTPLHIGTGNEIPEFEYQLDGQELLRISLSSLLASDPDAAYELSKFATRDGVMGYLKSRRAIWDDHLLYWLGGEGAAFDKSRKNDLAVRECVKASFGHHPLLPGSSLKGAMLTGWLFGEAWGKLSQADQTNLLQAAYTGFTVSLEEKLYQRLTRDNPEWGLKSKDEAPNLLSDRLWIGDIELDGDFEIRQAERSVKSRKSGAILLWVECVAAGATGSMFGRFREQSEGARKVAELCRRCNTFARCLIVAEQQFFDYCVRKGYLPARPAAYSDAGYLINRLKAAEATTNSCLVRIGWSSNKNAASLTLLNSSADLSRQPEGRNNPKRRPKSRWSLKDGTPLGWCVVTFEEDDYDEDR
jgi:hypothetical protein